MSFKQDQGEGRESKCKEEVTLGVTAQVPSHVWGPSTSITSH